MKVRYIEHNRVMLDHGSFNIISLHVLDAVGVLRENIIRHPMKVLGFGGACSYTMDL